MEASLESVGAAGARTGPAAHPRLAEAAALWWREGVSDRTLRRDERRWTAWTVWVVLVFALPGALLLYIELLAFPAAALCVAHAWAIPWLQAGRGARSAPSLGALQSEDEELGESDRVALGLLADLVGHRERDLLGRSGHAVQRRELGVWVLGEQGAFLVRPGGRRVDCWCVRIGEPDGLPPADRVAHLLLALREDEAGFATVANMNFSGAVWRVRGRLGERTRIALDAARKSARER